MLSWREIWNLFDTGEQRQAVAEFVAYIRSDKAPQKFKEPVLQRLAKPLRFRWQTLKTLSEERLQVLLYPYLPRILDSREWSRLFIQYYINHQRQIMCRFLDATGVPHNAAGEISNGWSAPDADAAHAAIGILEKDYGPKEILRYLAILVLQSPEWAVLSPHLQRLRDMVSLQAAPEKEAVAEQTTEKGPPESTSVDLSDDFTTLDRVLIDQIVGTVSGEEGALSHEQLDDLLRTVLALNAKRRRTYCHLGLMDALVPGREITFERPEFNDARREWYLAGALTGCVRKRTHDKFKTVLTERSADFTRAAGAAGGAGKYMARNIFSALIETGRISQAAQIVEGQLESLGFHLAWQALEAASDFLRRGDIASANPLLVSLRDNAFSLMHEDPEEYGNFAATVERRFGQCLQAQGDFPGARAIFERLLNDDPEDASTELLADMGLVAGAFRSLGEIRIPEAPERREGMRKALEKGEKYFRQAVETDSQLGIYTPNASYALAALFYLRYMDEGRRTSNSASLRDEALTFAQQATSAMRQHGSASAYESLGLIGRALFMQSILQMDRLDPTDAKTALLAWQQITNAAGAFPKQDLKYLLQAAELIDERGVVAIAESIWKYRQRDALDILADGKWVAHSEILRKAALELAREPANPRALRWKIWTWIIPALLTARETKIAAEGLDALEELSDDKHLAENLVSWLGDRAHYDPAWAEEEAAWSRIRLYRQLGSDEKVGPLLRQVFFRVRDANPFEAEQILETCREFGLDQSYYGDLSTLVPKRDDETDITAVTEQRLRRGEAVSLLFVGGNETQAQYDDAAAEELRKAWPGINVRFEHTGWTSNWGRQLALLKVAANKADAVVLMRMMRTMLGRELREAVTKPWVPCTGRGKAAILASLRKAAIIGLEQKL